MIVVNARFLTQQVTGVQRFASELSIRLKQGLRDNVMFVAPSNIIHKEQAKELGVKFIGEHTGYYWEQIELPKYLKGIGNPLLLSLCNVAPVFYDNNIVAIHDIIWKKFPSTCSRTFRIAYGFIIPRLCHSARHIITVSDFSKNEISSCFNIPGDKFTIIYNAVDKRFKKVDDSNLKKEKYFLAVSSVKANKNFITAIKAFNEFNKQNPECKFYIIGDINQKNYQFIDLESIAQNKNFKLLGRVSDEELIRYYSNAIAFLFPSFYEGFGIPVLEAQACGCPVISSNSSSMPEVLRNSALMSDPTDISKFTQLMKDVYLSKELREKLISNGYNNVKRFSWDNSVSQVIDIIDSLVN